MTDAERKLWYLFLKRLPLTVNRQKNIGNYIVDFFCEKARLAIELDGSQHCSPEKVEYDRKRTAYLESLGLKVIRFSNLDVMGRFRDVCGMLSGYGLHNLYTNTQAKSLAIYQLLVEQSKEQLLENLTEFAIWYKLNCM